MSDFVEYPKVSVFLITYNHKLFIRDAIESVLIQNYPNMELVIGDDCSTDGTQEILKEYKNKYPDLIKLILSERNTGVTANCNRILKECSGDYVAMFSGDDVWLPNKINKQIELFKKNPDAVFCYTKTEVFQNETGRILYICPQFRKIEECTIYDDILEFTYAIGGSVPSFMFLKKAIPAHGFESSIPTVSDWFFWVEAIRNGKVIYIDEMLARYRKHNTSTSTDLIMVFTEHLLTLNLFEKKFKDLPSYYVNKKRLSTILNYIHQMYINNLHNRDLMSELSKFSSQLSHLIEHFSQHLNAAKQTLNVEKNMNNLMKERKSLAESWLKVQPEFLEKAYSGDMGNLHRKLMESNLRNAALTEEEKIFFQHLSSELTRRSSVEPVSAMNYLLAIMLYLPSGSLKIENAETSLPTWLVGDYKKFFGGAVGQQTEKLDIKSLCSKYNIVPSGVIHIGAHEGQEVNTYISMGFKKILLVEANPSVFEKLKRKIAGIPNILAVNCAISNINGVINLRVNANDESSSILPLKHHKELFPNMIETAQVAVPSRTLDTLLQELKIDNADYNFINIDIQGAELMAFQGAVETLNRTDAICSEINFKELYEGCVLAEQLDNFLNTYSFERVDTRTPHRPEWGDAFYVKKKVLKSLP